MSNVGVQTLKIYDKIASEATKVLPPDSLAHLRDNFIDRNQLHAFHEVLPFTKACGRPARRTFNLPEECLVPLLFAIGEPHLWGLGPEYPDCRSSHRDPDVHRSAVVRNQGPALGEDRKSTRLNSSHANISYAVFCLKKKKQ